MSTGHDDDALGMHDLVLILHDATQLDAVAMTQTAHAWSL